MAQPIALLALGHRLKHTKPRLAKALAATVTAAAAVGFILAGEDAAVPARSSGWRCGR